MIGLPTSGGAVDTRCHGCDATSGSRAGHPRRAQHHAHAAV